MRALEDSASSDSVFEIKPERTQLKNHVYEALKQAIVSLQLPPGEALRETTMAERLGVSKTPVREALVRLQQEGFVVIEPFKGAVVNGYGPEDLREIYQLRELLEAACVRQAAEAMSTEDLRSLRAVVQDSRRALRERRDDDLVALFDAFDVLVFAQMTNGRIRTLLDNLSGHIVRIGRLSVGIPGRAAKSVAEHAEIYERIRARDAAGADAAMRRHVVSVLADHLASFPDGAD